MELLIKYNISIKKFSKMFEFNSILVNSEEFILKVNYNY